MSEESRFRIFILGAGFSHAAGLPLAKDLYGLVRAQIERTSGKETKFHRDLENYLEYRAACSDIPKESLIDLELLLSFLDLEHALQLRGSKTWSSEGNEGQLMVREAIGQVIHARTPAPDQIPDVYLRFAEKLEPYDTVITLNYDILLERALERVQKPYCLYPFQDAAKGELDKWPEQVSILKLHGSVDWFDDRSFLHMKQAREQAGLENPHGSIHHVFDNPAKFHAVSLANGHHHQNDANFPLRHIHRVQKVTEYYSDQSDGGLASAFKAPFILAPSHVKFVYLEPLLSLWRGLGREGVSNRNISVIGFSLPPHDEYLRVALFQLISNYQTTASFIGKSKDHIRFVDFQETYAAQAAYKARYQFADPAQSLYHFGGFDERAIDFIFADGNQTTPSSPSSPPPLPKAA